MRCMHSNKTIYDKKELERKQKLEISRVVTYTILACLDCETILEKKVAKATEWGP